MKPHLTRYVRQNPMFIWQLYPKHRVRQQFDYRAFDSYWLFFSHVKISASPSVTNTVCSKCALGAPSAETTVQPSLNITTSLVPPLIIGSIANVIPGFNFGPSPDRP
jgi:hypothetical protein